MPIESTEITAAASAAPTADQIPAPAEPAATSEDTLPDEVLQIPAVQGLLEGKPAAVYAVRGTKSPVIEAIPKHINELIQAGIGVYKSKDDLMSVMFNSRFISLEEIKKADQEGKLTEVAEPVDAVIAAYNTALSGETAPAGAATIPGEVPSSNLPASVEKKITTAGLKNLSPGSPTSGPAPGAGRVLNNVLKRAV